MAEAFGRRDILTARIKYGNYAANGFGASVALCVIMAFSTSTMDVWLIAAAFMLAGTIGTVRMVTAARIELFYLGEPGPMLVFQDEPDDEDWT